MRSRILVDIVGILVFLAVVSTVVPVVAQGGPVVVVDEVWKIGIDLYGYRFVNIYSVVSDGKNYYVLAVG